MDSAHLSLRAEVLDWRDAERLKIAKQTRRHYLGLDARIADRLKDIATRDLLTPQRIYRRDIQPMIATWIVEQDMKLRKIVNLSSTKSEQMLRTDALQNDLSWTDIAGVGAGAALTFAPIAAVPFVAGLATVTTTSFFVMTTSAISLPILAAALVGGGVAAYCGSSVLVSAMDRRRHKIIVRFQTVAANLVIGDPAKPFQPSLLRNILADIDRVARQRMENL